MKALGVLIIAAIAFWNTMKSWEILKMCMLVPVIQLMKAIMKMDPKGFLAMAMHCMSCIFNFLAASSFAGIF